MEIVDDFKVREINLISFEEWIDMIFVVGEFVFYVFGVIVYFEWV